MTLDQFSLAGKKALVTGASRGIGQSDASSFMTGQVLAIDGGLTVNAA
jgi:short-subunit dehydrogenase